MPRIDLLQDPLLSPAQEAHLTPLKDILREIEFPGDTSLTQTELLTGLIGKSVVAQTDAATFIKQQSSNSIAHRAARSTEELEWQFGASAFNLSGIDLTFKTYCKIISSQLGILDATDVEGEQEQDQLGEAKGRIESLGDNLILFRARMVGTFTLQAANLLYDVYPGISEEMCSWDRAKVAFERVPNVNPPVAINDEEGEVYDEVRNKAFETKPNDIVASPFGKIKFGRSKTINAIKAGVRMRRLMKDYSGATDDRFLTLLETGTNNFMMTAPPVAELEPDELVRGMRTVKKTLRYLGSAANLDPSIAQDPKVRFVAYLDQELDGYDVKSEHAVFDKDRKVAAKRERKLAKG